MAFKPYCEQCQTWHTEQEGHRVERPACEYCGPGIRTGLPGNACENCMNTGLKNPTAEDM